ncbi:phospholipid carrier-dependent glycosyltransferase [Pseudomonas sp.]|uniref:ArnT family glycosyltransferase n=1 Tax=Pseudomonas sp. TaxID=306 RepID=UPI0026373307|nr:phospholipid carrier-dependent glycosyltransferase [Pseudomonas sp.]
MRLTRPFLLLTLLTGLLMFFMLGNHQLQGSTESRVAGIAMQMHLSDDWVTPSLLNVPFLEKPPLSLWLDAGAIRVFGGEVFAVRLAAAFAGFFCVLLLYAMLRTLGRPTALAWVAAAMLATMGSFWANSRMVGEDALLTLGITMALLAFYHASRQAHFARGTWLLFTAGIVIATLSKGVLGLAMPGVVIFVFLVCESLMTRRVVVRNWLRPALMTLLGLIPLFIWLCMLYQRGGMQAVGEVLWTNSVGRFSGSFVEAGHYEPFYYYLRKLPETFLPWNLLTFLGLWHFRKQVRDNPYLLFFCVWVLAQFVLLNLASSKRAVYLMSLAPAAAVISAEYAFVVLQWLREKSATSPLARCLSVYHRPLAATLLAGVVVAFLMAALAAPRADKTDSFQPMAAHAQTLEAQGKRIALLQPDERLGAMVFYRQQLQTTLASPAELQAFLSASPDNIAIVEYPDVLGVPLNILDTVSVGRHHYYFVSLPPVSPDH